MDTKTPRDLGNLNPKEQIKNSLAVASDDRLAHILRGFAKELGWWEGWCAAKKDDNKKVEPDSFVNEKVELTLEAITDRNKERIANIKGLMKELAELKERVGKPPVVHCENCGEACKHEGLVLFVAGNNASMTDC